MTAKVIFSLPDQLVIRMKVAIPARDRSKVIAVLLEREIVAREQSLYRCAREFEASSDLKDEMITWGNEFGRDGLF